MLLRRLERSFACKLSLFTALLLLVVASHLGGSMTHGRRFLTQYAPGPLRALVGDRTVRQPPWSLAAQPQTVFAGLIQPILNHRCVSCHGAEKHKAQLRLDTLEGLRHGGQDGPVIQEGRAHDSPLVQCLVSAMDADGHMPPEGQPQPTAAEIAWITRWINSGASASEKIGAPALSPETRRLQEMVSRPTDSQN